MKKVSLLSLALFLTTVCSSIGVGFAQQNYETDFSEAVQLYKQNKFDQSAEKLNALLEQGVQTANIYYNLGNAKYKAGLIGEAIWSYERARVLAPRDKDIRWNLETAKESATKRIRYHDPILTLDQLNSKVNYLASREIAISFTGAILLLCALALLYVLIAPLRGFLRGLAMLDLCVILLISVPLMARMRVLQSDLSIVQEREVYVRYGPDDSNTKAYLLQEGSEVSIEEESKNWFFIRFGEAQSGWVPKESLLRINGPNT
ncbi:MAG: tetratricopeptide (TPR) repeat protein [Candidatus Omnitrophota bacterium]|jgi:tetratricopeptide (TPR) repeat protein